MGRRSYPGAPPKVTKFHPKDFDGNHPVTPAKWKALLNLFAKVIHQLIYNFYMRCPIWHMQRVMDTIPKAIENDKMEELDAIGIELTSSEPSCDKIVELLLNIVARLALRYQDPRRSIMVYRQYQTGCIEFVAVPKSKFQEYELIDPFKLDNYKHPDQMFRIERMPAVPVAASIPGGSHLNTAAHEFVPSASNSAPAVDPAVVPDVAPPVVPAVVPAVAHSVVSVFDDGNLVR